MNAQQTTRLIRKFFTHPTTNDVKSRFGKWLISNHLNDDKDEVMLTLWEEEVAMANTDTFEDLLLMHDRINKESRKRLLFFRFMKVAAAVSLLLVGSFTSHLLFNSTSSVVETKMLQCFVPNGERRSIKLPDGSVAYLNAGSLLIYPEKFNSNTRTLYLSGEAEFTVVKNREKPFIVKTNYIDVEALGTVFTVTSYPGDSISEAMLERGSVLVGLNKKVPENHILVPNDLLTYSHNSGKMTIQSIDAQQRAKWKQGYLIFRAATLSEIFKDIERRHNVAIYFDSQKIGTGIYNVKFRPNETVKENFEVLGELIEGFNYKIKGNTIYVN